MHQKPEDEEEHGRNFNDLQKNENRYQRENPGKRVGHHIRAQNARDRPARSDAGHRGLRIQQRVDNSRAQTAEQVKYEVREMTQPVFNVVSENPEVPHITDQMEPAAMQEYRSEKRQRDNGKGNMGVRPGEYRRRNNSIMHDESFEAAASKRQLVKKDADIGYDDRDRDDWK